MQQEFDDYKLFVGGLPQDISEDDLRHVFSTYGTLTKVHIMDKLGANGHKAAFVAYQEKKSGEDAISVLNGVYKIRVDAEQAINVKWAKPKGQGGEASNDGGSPDGHKLFIGSLPTDCTEHELKGVFQTYGEVTKIHMLEARAASQQRCALLFYKEKKSAEDAIQVLHEQYKIRADAEKPIEVKWAQNKNKGKDDKGKGKGYDDGKGKGKGKNDGSYGGYDGGKGQGQGQGWNAGGWDSGNGNQGWQGQQQQQQQPQQQNWQGGDSWNGNQNQHQNQGWQGGNQGWNGGNGGDGGWNNNGNNGGGDGGWGQQGQGQSYGKADGKGKGDKGSGKGKGDEGPGCTLFIGNLPADTPESSIEFVFKTYGQVHKISLLNKPSQNGSIAAFVEYAEPDQAATAIAALDGKYEIKTGHGNLSVAYSKRQGRSRPY